MKSGKQLMVGAGRADTTPAMGVQIGGDIGRYRPVEEIRDKLHARVMVVTDGEKTACVISSDLCSARRNMADKLRGMVAEYLDTDSSSVILHATQSHSAPEFGNGILSDDYLPNFPENLDWVRGGDARYNDFFMERVIGAVKDARASMEPVRLKAGRGFDCRVATNRRYISRDDTGIYQAQRDDPNVLCWEGPIDPEVGVATFENDAGQIKCVLLHHTCHPCHGYPKRWISADWPGYWAGKMEEHFGNDCVALVLNGACGNILHGNPLDPGHKGGIEVKGGHLVETTERVLPSLEESPCLPLNMERKMVPISLRKVGDDVIEQAAKLVKENPEPIWKDEARTAIDWSWVHAHRLLDDAERKKKTPEYSYEIQTLRMGDLVLISWPGEPFVEAQLEVKMKAPARYVFVAHLCNDTPGYQPTRKAFKYGGYEVEWTDFDEDTLDTVVRETKSALQAVYRA